MEVVETVDEHCKHEDCIYRCRLNFYNTDYCNYAVIVGESRGCSISECDKYKRGKRKVAMTDAGLWWFVIEEDDDSTVYR